MKTIKALIIGLAVAGLTCVSQAVPITGSITFTTEAGSWTGDTADVNTISEITSFGNVTVSSRTGSFATGGVSVGDSVTMMPLDFTTPVISNPLWSVGIFSFDLQTLNGITRTDNVNPTPDTLGLSGLGMLTAAGFDDTYGGWTWSGELNGTMTFSFSSTTVAGDRVPEGGTTALLMGLALLSVGAIRRFVVRA